MRDVTYGNIMPYLTSVIEITHEMVMDKLNALSLDGLHPYFLYSLADNNMHSAKILFTESLREGVVLSHWLEACIMAIHKKGLRVHLGITVL